MSVIDDYLAGLTEPERAALERVRAIAMTEAPEATDTIGYGMPVLKHRGKYLLGFRAFRQHLSIFPGAGAIEAVKAELGDYVQSKGTIQFTLDKPLPEAIIRQVVAWRRDDIDKAEE